MDFSELFKILHTAQAIHQPLAYVKISIKDITIEKLSLINERKIDAIQSFTNQSMYDPKSYDINRLTDEVVYLIKQALSTNSDFIDLPNRCCSIENCPSIIYQKILIQHLI